LTDQVICYVSKDTKHQVIFIFEWGVIVFWGFSQQDEKCFIDKLENYIISNPAEKNILLIDEI